MDTRRLMVVSNRLPIILDQDDMGKWTAMPGAGGLVTAMGSVFRDRGGLWVGWLGTSGEYFLDSGQLDTLLEKETASSGFSLHPVELSLQDVENYYAGFSNKIIWPLFHEFSAFCSFDPNYWLAYKAVNKKFAATVAQCSSPSDYVWVHDYHLMLVAQELRQRKVCRRTGFFLHIPFPPLDLFLKLPWRAQLLNALLCFDLIGFQTVRDMRNFTHCIFNLIPEISERGQGQVRKYMFENREVRVGSFPISIDFHHFSQIALRQGQEESILPDRRKEDEWITILGVDRLDYTKGIPLRLRAISVLLENHPEFLEKIIFKQVVVPSRQDVDSYDQLKLEIEQLVGEINGKFSRNGWIPVHYIFQFLDSEELVHAYRHSAVCLVTPIKDGMNLVSKEYCACHNHNKGVLILSEFAGAAAELKEGALLVNPYDVYGVTEALHQALTMSEQEQKDRMRLLRSMIERNDIFHWANSFLHAAITKDLSHFPRARLFVPDSKPSEK